MPDEILRIDLSELRVIRIICQCGGVAEIPIDVMATKTGLCCPVCQSHFSVKSSGQAGDALTYLARGISELNRKGQFPFDVELVVNKG